jgi:CubicO group peptidase (beta-lactamase class C family)
MFRTLLVVVALSFTTISNAQNQKLYFPPLSGPWETVSPSSLNWCNDRIDSLVDFVGKTNGKALIILKDGRIALEKYYGTFTGDSLWYWASAGKTVTSVLVGMAQEEGIMDITKPSATYLGYGWSSCTKQQEEKITVRHHLTMTTGIDFARDNDDCTDPACLTYRGEPGTIWDYHNATYLLLQDMVAKASGITYQQYYTRKLGIKLGMGGIWYNGTLYSKPLAMARFGLMLLAGGIWNGDTIIRDRAYCTDMINTSQNLNKSYGYLFWLNGKGSFMQPGIPLVYRTDLVPEAPDDMYAGMGKNDQRVYVVPSKGLVVVRMGDKATESLPAISGFDDDVWRRVNQLECTSDVDDHTDATVTVWPNPTSSSLLFNGDQIKVYDINGTEVYAATGGNGSVEHLARGMYRADVYRGSTIIRTCIVKL